MLALCSTFGFGLLTWHFYHEAARLQEENDNNTKNPAPIHEGPLAQRRCSFWAAGCGVIRAQGLAPHGLRVLEAARAPQGGVPSASGWVGPLGAFQARHRPRSGVATVSPRYCYGIATVYPRCISHVDGINMGAIPGQYRGDTVRTPCLLACGCVPPSLKSRRGSVQRKR